MKKKIVTITNGDELMQAVSDVCSTPFGNVGQHIHYVVEKDALKKSQYYEDWELKMAVNEMTAHPRSRLDISAVADQGYSPVVDKGKYNHKTGEMEHPDTSVKTSGSGVDLPDFTGINHWTLFWTFLMIAWMPFQSWVEAETGYKAATWLYCYPVPVFFLLIGVSYAINRMRE